MSYNILWNKFGRGVLVQVRKLGRGATYYNFVALIAFIMFDADIKE